MKKRRNFRLLGNFFILVGVFLLVFIYAPFVQAKFFPPLVLEAGNPGETRIVIPKIHVSSLVLENVDPWNEDVYQKALEKGVAHAKGTSLPGQNGMTFLFAHSSGPPWEQTHTNTLFLRLNELQKGDVITIYRKGIKYEYQVSEKKELWPDEVGYLLENNKDELILQTCTPIGTDLKRLLVFAEPL